MLPVKSLFAGRDQYAGAHLAYGFSPTLSAAPPVPGIAISKCRKIHVLEAGVAAGVFTGGTAPSIQCDILAKDAGSPALSTNNKGSILYVGTDILVNANNTYAIKKFKWGQIIAAPTSVAPNILSIGISPKLVITGSPTSVTNVAWWIIYVPIFQR